MKTFAEKIEALKEQHEPRITAWLKMVTDAIRAAGFGCTDPVEMTGYDEYTWGFDVDLFPNEPDSTLFPDNSFRRVGCTFAIFEGDGAMENDGDGIAIGLNSIYWGGRIDTPSLMPFNFTRDWFVDINDPAAIEQRFALFDENAAKGVADAIAGARRRSQELRAEQGFQIPA